MSGAEHWERWAERWALWARRPNFDGYWRDSGPPFFELVPQPGRRTIEIGCGEGRVARDLKTCDAEQLAAFKTYQVEAFSAPIMRYGKTESVVVVARNGDQVIYYEDVENGFNVSPIGPDGTVLEHWCNAHPCGLQKMLHKYQEA